MDELLELGNIKKGKKIPKFEVKLFGKLDNGKIKLIESEIERMSNFLEVQKLEVEIHC